MGNSVNLQAIEELLKSEGISLEELGSRTGLDVLELKMLLRGEREFTASEIYRFADILGLSEGERSRLFFGE